MFLAPAKLFCSTSLSSFRPTFFSCVLYVVFCYFFSTFELTSVFLRGALYGTEINCHLTALSSIKSDKYFKMCRTIAALNDFRFLYKTRFTSKQERKRFERVITFVNTCCPATPQTFIL